jgi:X-Pro dipeptidyl-peptidase
MKAVVVALLSIAALLAGCSETPKAPPAPAPVSVLPEQYAGYELLPLDFSSGDGTYIHATAYLPRQPRSGHDQAERFGTIVNFSPYYTNLYGIDTDGRLNAVASGRMHLNETGTGLLVAHGFAYVAASVPGTGHSGGCFELGGRHEQTVMAEFIDWVGTQPWSNGNVGMAGGSYDGTTQWMAAIHHPEHLKTIVPHVSITDMYNYEYQDGAPYAWWGPYFLPHYLLLVGWNADPAFGPLPNPDPDLLFEDLCPEVKDHFVEAEKTYETGVYDPWWQARDYARDMPQITASVFLVHGLWDWNVKPIHLDVWDRIPTEKVFWLQQMQHNVPWRDTYKPEFSRPDYNATLLAWYDHYLNGADNGVPGMLPAAWTQDHTGLWRTETRWPPAEATPAKLFLGPGSLTAEKPAAGTTTFVTPPSYVGAVAEPNVGVAGPNAPDAVVAKFATEALAAPLRISGVPHLELNLSVDRAGYGHVVAELWSHHADGSWAFLGMGGRGLAERNGRTHDDAVNPMERMAVPVDLDPTESYVAAGDQLVLLLSGDDTDWFHPNGNTPTFMLEHGSSLSIPVLPQDAPRGLDSKAMAAQNPFYQADPKEF